MTKVFVDIDEVLRQYFAGMAKKRVFIPRRPSWRSCACCGPRVRCRCGTCRAILNESKPTGYTSVLDTMETMADKRLFERDDSRKDRRFTVRATPRTAHRNSCSPT